MPEFPLRKLRQSVSIPFGCLLNLSVKEVKPLTGKECQEDFQGAGDDEVTENQQADGAGDGNEDHGSWKRKQVWDQKIEAQIQGSDSKKEQDSRGKSQGQMKKRGDRFLFGAVRKKDRKYQQKDSQVDQCQFSFGRQESGGMVGCMSEKCTKIDAGEDPPGKQNKVLGKHGTGNGKIGCKPVGFSRQKESQTGNQDPG